MASEIDPNKCRDLRAGVRENQGLIRNASKNALQYRKEADQTRDDLSDQRRQLQTERRKLRAATATSFMLPRPIGATFGISTTAIEIRISNIEHKIQKLSAALNNYKNKIADVEGDIEYYNKQLKDNANEMNKLSCTG